MDPKLSLTWTWKDAEEEAAYLSDRCLQDFREDNTYGLRFNPP